jgi:hypothetical protein
VSHDRILTRALADQTQSFAVQNQLHPAELDLFDTVRFEASMPNETWQSDSRVGTLEAYLARSRRAVLNWHL